MNLDFDDATACPDIVQQMGTGNNPAEAGSKRKSNPKKAKGPQLKTCFARGCESECQKSKRWCGEHNKAYDNLYYQAKKAGETETLEKTMKDADLAKKAFDHFFEQNPGDGKWRRKCLVNWSQWKRQFIHSQVKRVRDGCKPFEFGQWLIRCQTVMGWSKESARAEWEKHSKDSSLKKDTKGLDGCDRIWIPVIEETHKDKDRIRSSIYQEGGVQEKNLGEEDREILLKHVKRNTHAEDHDEFFVGGQDSSDEDTHFVTPKKRPAEETDNKETPAEKKARIKLEKLTNNGPNFTAYKNTCGEKIKKKLKAIQTASTNVRTRLNEGLTKVQEAKTAHPDDAVLESFGKCLKASFTAVKDWDQDQPLPDDEEACRVLLATMTKELQASVSSVGENVRLVNGDATLHPRLYFVWRVREIQKISNAKDVAEHQTKIMKTLLPTVELFLKGVFKVITDVANYIKQKEKNQQRAEAKKKKEEDQADIERAKEAARTAAAKVKMFNKQAHKIFGLKESMWIPVHERQGANFDVDGHLDSPWVLRKSDAAKTWRNLPEASLKLSEFGGSYRKAPSCKQDNRAMAPVLSKHGKEEAESMIKSVFPATKNLNMTSLKEASNFENNMWYWGFDSKLSGGFLAPNAAAMLRVVAMGSVTVVAFDLRRVVDCMDNKSPTLQEVTEFVLELQDVLKDADGNIIGHGVTLTQDDILFVPTGWIMAEQVNVTSLTYGVRKSFLLDTPAAKASYNTAVDLMKRSGRDASRMEEIAKLFSDDAEGKCTEQSATPAMATATPGPSVQTGGPGEAAAAQPLAVAQSEAQG